MSLKPSPDQQAALIGMLRLINTTPSNASCACILTGFAGSGKTTVVTQLLIELEDNNLPYSLAATTHKAASVLSDITGRSVATVYSLFGLRPSVNRQGVETIVRTTRRLGIVPGSVVLIDESSMVSNKLLTKIAHIAKELYLRVIFVGDKYQLDPTKGICTIFDGSLPTFELTTMHRQQAGNPILDLADQYRAVIDKKTTQFPQLSTQVNQQGEGIHLLEEKEFTQKFVSKYLNYTVGTKVDIPLCAYTNAKAIQYNAIIRKSKYFLEDVVQPFYPGELLVCNSSVLEGNKVILNNNQECLVHSYTSSIKDNFLNGYMVAVTPMYAPDADLTYVFVPRSSDELKAYKDKLVSCVKSPEDDLQWPDYYSRINSIADLRPPFAGTTHKAQGGTYTSVFIDKKDIDTCRNPITRAKLMYVALTRARKNVYVLS